VPSVYVFDHEVDQAVNLTISAVFG
jgi:hypothetical protein